ncbi:MAG: VOC family protein [Methylophilales bacterium]|nr:VOC family protein [Methylophilales bacterium]
MIDGINHYNLRSDIDTMESLKKFYIDVVGLTHGFRPPFESQGYWLYAGEKDVLHLSSTKEGDHKVHHVNSTFDHMAFSATDLDSFVKKLELHQIKYYFREVPEIGTRQIFFKDPVGNGVELIFI